MERAEKLRTQTRPRNATRHVTWYPLFPKSRQNVTKGLIIVWRAGYSSLVNSLLESRHTSLQTILSTLVKSCSLVEIKIPCLATFPLRFSYPDALKTQNPAPALNWNSPFPLLFSAPIPNIATKISQIPHPAKPIVNSLFREEEYMSWKWLVWT